MFIRVLRTNEKHGDKTYQQTAIKHSRIIRQPNIRNHPQTTLPTYLLTLLSTSHLRVISPPVPVVEAAVRGAVARGALAPGAAPVLVAGARDQRVHGGGSGLLHADAAATAARVAEVRHVAGS